MRKPVVLLVLGLLVVAAAVAQQVVKFTGAGVPVTITAGGTGTVTSAVIAGTANQITVAGTCTITTTGTCTLSLAGPYVSTVTAQTAVSLAAATHGQGTNPYAACLTNDVPRLAVICSYTAAANGDLVFAFNPAFTGTIQVRP